MQTHLAVVSVPWRRSSLERLLSAVAAQSSPPDRIALLLQRYETLPAIPAALRSRVEVRNLRRNVGPAVRWIWVADNVPAGDLTLILDDDFVPEREYIRATTAPILEGRADVVGWFGVDRDWTHYRASSSPARDVAMHVVAGGACAFRREALDGLREHKLADLLCTLDGGDDLWSSCVFRQNGARMLRPAGRGPITSTEHQNDLRSIRWTRGLDSGKLFFVSELLG